MPKVKFFTLGCKVNQYETQAIRESFLDNGYNEVNSDDIADVYCINSCTVTSRADGKSRDLIKKAQKENPIATVIMTGCFVEDNKSDIIKSNQLILIKNNFKNRIVEILNNDGFIPKPAEPRGFVRLNITDFKGHDRAFVKIQDGCNNNCSYCKIPLVRGRVKSRDLSDIKEEALRLINNGFKEIVLTGICLGAYGTDFSNGLELADVIKELMGIAGEFRMRLSSIEAKDVSNKIIELISGSKKLCRHLHIPFQSGDNDILHKMNRNYRCEDYLTLVRKLRSKIPEIAVTTDIMVGFPSENEESFNNTYDFLKEVSPSRMHIFPFSPRKGTLAFDLPDRPSPKTVNARIKKLQALARQSSFEYRRKFLGKEVEVLVESQASKNNRYLQGYSDNYINVWIDSKDDLSKRIVRVIITEVSPDFTLAKPV